MTDKCISCKKKASDYIKMKCPECGTEIIRCQHCRSLDISYKCPNPKCKLEGP